MSTAVKKTKPHARRTSVRPRAGSIEHRLESAATRFSDTGVVFSEVTRAAYRRLLEAETPLAAYDLIETLQVTLGKRLHPPTIYRALTQLIAQGLVHRIESTNTYFPCSGPEAPHDGIHFLCTACGVVDEAIDTRVAALVAEDASGRGFVPERPVIEVRGICRHCRG